MDGCAPHCSKHSNESSDYSRSRIYGGKWYNPSDSLLTHARTHLLTHSGTDIYLDSAIQHLSLCRKYPALAGIKQMDVNFHLSLAFIAKLHIITDRVPWGVSLTRTLIEQNAMVLTLTHSLTHSPTYALTHLLTHSLTHSLIQGNYKQC